MLIRIFPNKAHQLALQNVCDGFGVKVLFGAGLPQCDVSIEGFDKDCDGKPLGGCSLHEWLTAYLDVSTIGDALVVQVGLRLYIEKELQNEESS